ncbi:hypothetical protein EYF80_041169 [Liparis tanakae]|uniref:Uncharacterized protein n=1 Tax=Liparis tanakae TaxID=230148 RepID=A0A4Z2G5V2_9TELE|nr:hypothetical protein EYF80_041169 [Liparis tanakae]
MALSAVSLQLFLTGLDSGSASPPTPAPPPSAASLTPPPVSPTSTSRKVSVSGVLLSTVWASAAPSSSLLSSGVPTCTLVCRREKSPRRRLHSRSTPSLRPLSVRAAARSADTASLRCWFSSSNGGRFTSTVKLSARPTTNSSSYLTAKHHNTHLGAVHSSLRQGKEWMVLRRSLFSLLTRRCSMERSCSTCPDRESTWFCRMSMDPVNLSPWEEV